MDFGRSSKHIWFINFFRREIILDIITYLFPKKLPEKKSKLITSDKIKLNFKLTKFEPSEEITEEKINEYKRFNFGQDFIFIKGFKIKGFKGNKENPKDIKTYKEIELDEIKDKEKMWELLPVIAVSYSVKEFQVDTKIANRGEKDDNDDEDEEENEMPFEEKNEVKTGKMLKSTEIKKTEENKKVEIKQTQEVNVIQQMKIRYFKKHCKLDIPFKEENPSW